MQPIEFNEANDVYGDTQNQYLTLPVFTTHKGPDRCRQVFSCWKLSDTEKREVLEKGVIWVRMDCGQYNPQPVKPSAFKPSEIPHQDCTGV